MRVKFTNLEPQWCKYIEDGVWRVQDEGGESITPETADGIMFLHPEQFERNGAAIGTSCVLLWFRGRVPDSATPGPGRWDLINPDFEHFEISPSVDLTAGGQYPGEWHGWIKDGWAI
jgi:hypothetical protein